MAGRYKPKTVAGICSALRAFLRYLHVAGLAKTDLSALVIRAEGPCGSSRNRITRGAYVGASRGGDHCGTARPSTVSTHDSARAAIHAGLVGSPCA